MRTERGGGRGPQLDFIGELYDYMADLTSRATSMSSDRLFKENLKISKTDSEEKMQRAKFSSGHSLLTDFRTYLMNLTDRF